MEELSRRRCWRRSGPADRDRRAASRPRRRATTSSRSSRTREAAAAAADRLKGTRRLANAAIVYPDAVSSRSCCCCWAFRCGGACARNRARCPTRPSPRYRLRRLDDRHRTGAATWLLVPLLGATEFKVRYMYPGAPHRADLGFHDRRARPARQAAPSAFSRSFSSSLRSRFRSTACSASNRWTGDRPNCWPCKIRTPYASIAAKLRAAGYDGEGTILADSMTHRRQFACAVSACASHATSVLARVPGRPPRATGSAWLCGLLPAADLPLSCRNAQASYLAGALHGEPDEPHREWSRVRAGLRRRRRHLSMAYRLYDAPTGDCR